MNQEMTLSFRDLVNKVGGTPDSARPVVFQENSAQFKAPGVFADDPLSSKRVYNDAIDSAYEMVEQSETLIYGYNDVAVCMTRVLRRCTDGIARSVKANPFTIPAERVVKTGYDQNGVMRHETIPGDWMTIPGLDGRCRATANRDGTGSIQFEFRRFCQDAINGFFAFIREELELRSIYRDQIITSDYEFVNVAGFQRDQVVYNRDLTEAVKVACISPIVDLEVLIADGRKPKRSVLLAGDPGTGKTLLFNVAQSLLFEMGYMGVIVPAGGSAADMHKGLKIARAYMRDDAIVGLFIEDIEKMAEHDRSLALDNLDGSIAKSDRILIMMTTNFPDGIDAAFLRPGRIDDFIEVGLPDLDAFTRLLQQHLGHRLAPDVDFAEAFAAYHDYTPAWIVGGMEKVVRSVIARTHSAENITVTTQDLITGATLLRRQWELQHASATKPKPAPSIDQAIRQAIREENAESLTLPVVPSIGEIGETVDNVVENRIDGASIGLKTEQGKVIEGNLSTC
jgi:ATPase family associated with various cellular activities (AAA)